MVTIWDSPTFTRTEEGEIVKGTKALVTFTVKSSVLLAFTSLIVTTPVPSFLALKITKCSVEERTSTKELVPNSYWPFPSRATDLVSPTLKSILEGSILKGLSTAVTATVSWSVLLALLSLIVIVPLPSFIPFIISCSLLLESFVEK